MSALPHPMGTIAIATTVMQAMPSPAVRVGTPKGKPKPPRTAIDGHNSSKELHRGLYRGSSRKPSNSS